MSDNLHRKLYSKIQHGQDDMPDFSPDEWLQLDNRLSLAERRKKRKLFLLASIPFLLLLGINGLLGWKLWTHTHVESPELNTMNHKVVFDTIYNKVTIHQYDTIYHTIYRSKFTNSPTPTAAYEQQLASNQPSETALTTPSDNAALANDPQQTIAGYDLESTDQETRAKLLQMIPYLAMSMLNHPQKQWYDLFREIPVRPASPRKVAFLRKGHLTFGVGPVISWKDGIVGSGGKSISLGNTVDLGSERLSWWQELSWNELRLKTESVINGFPNPPSPDPNAKLDKTIFYRRDLAFNTGIGYGMPLHKKLEAGIKLGIGTNYRLGGNHLLDYEDHDNDTHFEIAENISSAWDGWNAAAGLGFNWNLSKSWGLQLDANYHHYLGAGKTDWRIPSWATLRVGMSYRWR